jgi:glucose dehydrogenase
VPDRKRPERPPLFPLIMTIIIAVIGIWTTVFGAWLAVLGGSL